jgi:hypothetical protein
LLCCAVGYMREDSVLETLCRILTMLHCIRLLCLIICNRWLSILHHQADQPKTRTWIWKWPSCLCSSSFGRRKRHSHAFHRGIDPRSSLGTCQQTNFTMPKADRILRIVEEICRTWTMLGEASKLARTGSEGGPEENMSKSVDSWV